MKGSSRSRRKIAVKTRAIVVGVVFAILFPLVWEFIFRLDAQLSSSLLQHDLITNGIVGTILGIALGVVVYTTAVVRKQREELREANEKIRESQLEIRKLEGILPICSNCRQVRSDDDETWLDVDQYLQQRPDVVQLSHGLCPQCQEEMGLF